VDTWTAGDLIEDEEDMEMEGFAGKVSKMWDGTPGMPFIVWQQGVDSTLRQMRCKNFSRPMSAGVQLGLVLTTIIPFSTGAAAHQQGL
jgi:hypothetical protein